MSAERAPLAEGDALLRPSEMAPAERRHVDRHLDSTSAATTVSEDIRLGLTGEPKSLPPKYFYDATGSALFEEITRLPEYYLTRAEQRILTALAAPLMGELRPRDVVELGSGSMAKVSMLLSVPGAADHVRRYIPFDVDEQVVQAAVDRVAASYPWLDAHGVAGDFERDLVHLPPPIGRRLVVFFGSTIGNLDPSARQAFLAQVRTHMERDDRLLLGVDLVKDPAVLEAAYNDSRGVTAAFNRNILRVVNRAAQGDFRPDAFRHLAFYNRDAARIEMHLSPRSPQMVTLRALELTVRVSPDETIWTESSHKFTRASTEAMLTSAGMAVAGWHTDPAGRFALALAGPA